MTEILNFALGSESNDYKWTVLAFDLINQGKLNVTLAGQAGIRVIASGNCPRCDHDVGYSCDETIVVPQGSSGTLSQDTTQSGPAISVLLEDSVTDLVKYVTIPVLCQCRVDHPGGPSKSLGCGISFNTELRL